MNIKLIVSLVGFVAIAIALLIGTLYVSKTFLTKEPVKDEAKVVEKDKSPPKAEDAKESSGPDELTELSAKMISDLQAENRLNLNMLGQLRTYRQMLDQIQSYARQVEKQINIVEEISKDEFQEDVKLQASLFSGKKPELVAKHLEEFKASRVGAILAKMKEKEASAVLDIWAKDKDPRVSNFYRETMAAYLNNRRREMHPEIFDRFKQDSTASAPAPPAPAKGNAADTVKPANGSKNGT